MALLAGCDDGPIPPRVETIVTGLNNPTDVALLTGGTLAVVESGASRVITVAADGTTSPLITGFSLGTFFPYDIGPLSLIVQSDGTLIVGEGGGTIGRERVSFFDSDGVELSDSALVPVSGGNFYDLAIHPLSGDLYVTSANTDRIFRARVAEGGGFDDLTEFVADTTLPPIGHAAPTAVAFDDAGVLLVGFADFSGSGIVRLSTDDQADSVFINEIYSTERMVTAIAIRPSDGIVFFAEFDFAGVRQSRIGQLRGSDEAQTFLSDVVAPSALTFAPDDTLYVTTLGETPNADTGAVLKLTVETFGAPASVDEEPPQPSDEDQTETDSQESSSGG